MLSNICIAQTLELTINGLRNNNGSIILSFYTNAESFDEEKPAFFKMFPKTEMIDNKLNITIEKLEPGAYAIALIDDENNNKKLDKRFLVPTEGFAFSNFPFKEKRKPDFDSFCFTLNNEIKQVEFEVYYF